MLRRVLRTVQSSWWRPLVGFKSGSLVFFVLLSVGIEQEFVVVGPNCWSRLYGYWSLGPSAPPALYESHLLSI